MIVWKFGVKLGLLRLIRTNVLARQSFDLLEIPVSRSRTKWETLPRDPTGTFAHVLAAQEGCDVNQGLAKPSPNLIIRFPIPPLLRSNLSERSKQQMKAFFT